ncbi:MAG: class I SAM-dependent methyltransferase [Treponema sp.]|nr:class I SAM-dependent methyltransferase [Treponema sp.]
MNEENKNQYQAQLFTNRLKKKYKELRKTMRKNRISSYRLYDRDIPEIPLSLDLYEFLPSDIDNPIEAARFLSDQNARLSANEAGFEASIKERTYAVLYLYERPYQKDQNEEEEWLKLMAKAAAEVIGIRENQIIKKARGHKNHQNDNEKENIQYQKNDSFAIQGITQEAGQLFRLDLNSYLDTGLFFDHRPLRSKIRDISAKKRVLNLFSYTASFSVYAAQGNAARVESVDLSNTYLAWAKDNMKLNGFTDKNKYIFTRADCMRFLQEKAVNAKANKLSPEELYDLIILDPPTFSNSKKSQEVLDINRDWPQLVKDCLNILAPGGKLYFSTNSERLKFDQTKIPPKTAAGLGFTCKDITEETIPADFAGKKPHKVWEFSLNKSEKL